MSRKKNNNPKPPTGRFIYPRKTKMEKWGAIPVDYTKRPNESTDQYTNRLRKELKNVRQQTARRLAALNKNSKFFSYAGYAFEQEMKKMYLKVPSVNQLDYQGVEKELRMHHQFWASKTSSEKGMRDETLRQSARIFGIDQSGRINRVFTKDEGREYWKTYYKFYELNHEGTAKYDSNRIQRILGEAATVVDLTDIDAVAFFNRLKKTFDEDYESGGSMSISEIQASVKKVLFMEDEDGDDFYG